MKKIAFLFLIILFLFPILGEATCCEKKISGGETVACSEDFASASECSSWAGTVSSWFPTADNCDYVHACTQLTGEIPIAPTPTYQLEVPLGETTQVTGFNEYIKIIYRFGIGLIALIALFLIVFNGINWILAGGNDQRIGEAKTAIVSAIIGLLLALSSYVILYTINPNLVNLEVMQIPLIQFQETEEVLDFDYECVFDLVRGDPWQKASDEWCDTSLNPSHAIPVVAWLPDVVISCYCNPHPVVAAARAAVEQHTFDEVAAYCYDWNRKVYNSAGAGQGPKIFEAEKYTWYWDFTAANGRHPTREEIAPHKTENGPMATIASMKPGDWIYIFNDNSADEFGDHSELFLGWVDYAARIGETAGFSGPGKGSYTTKNRDFNKTPITRIYNNAIMGQVK
ncbi:MAG: pilin [Patescibacteria group bacterium]